MILLFRVTLVFYLIAFNFIYSKNNVEIEVFEESYLKKFETLIDTGCYTEAFVLSYSVTGNLKQEVEWQLYVELLYKLANRYYKTDSYDSAKVIITLADSIIRKIDFFSNDLKSESSYLKALLQYHSQDWDNSKTHFLRAIKFAKRGGNDSIVALSLKSVGNIYFNLREYDSSLFYYNKSIQVTSTLSNPSKILISSLLQNIGISYSMLNENDSAMVYLKKSILLKEKYLKADDPFLASGYLNISRLIQLNGDLNEALRYIDKAEQIYVSTNGLSSNFFTPLYLNKGSILLTLNDYEEALRYHELAFEQYKTSNEENSEIITGLYLNLGLIYNYLDRVDESIYYLELCLTGDLTSEQKVKAYSFLGLSFLKKNNLICANENLRVAMRISEEELGSANLQTANTFLNYGVFCEQAQNGLSIDYYLKAAVIYTNIFGNKNRDLSNTYTLVGNYFLNVGEPKKALNYFQKALIAFIEDYNEVDNYKNPPSSDLDVDLNLFYTLSGKAKAFYLTYDNHSNDVRDLKASLETAIIAIDLLERIKSTLQGENTKLLVNSRASEIYNIAVLVASELYNLTGEYIYLESAFKYSEKSKGAILLSSLKEMEALQIGNLPEGIKEEEKHLKKAIAQYQNIIYEENQKSPLDSNKVSRLRNRLFESKLKYDSLVASIEANYPEYYNLKYNFDVISITDVQRNLENGQALIEYKLTDSTLFTFIISEDSAAVIGKNVGTSFTDKINKYLDLINRLPKTDSVSDRSLKFAKLGFELTNVLELNNPLIKNCEKLIVVPDDVLGYLSFDALVSDMPELGNSRYNKLNYLIYRHTLSYGYSGSLFFNREDKKPRRSNVLAIAPSYNNIDSSKQLADNNGINRNLEKYLIPLPFTSDEVNAVVKIFKGTQQVGANATETGFKASAADYSILHFAMHTLINDEDPLASKLVFSLNNDTLNDGFLNTYEIYNLELNAELAVLSACQTGAGKLSKGEGIMSLARGFLFAGVPGIIMTLWAVEDISGAEIVTSFYEYLYDGQNKDVALRKAKLAYLENADQLRAHPYFWAAYVQIGDNGPVSSKTNTNIYYFIAGAILLGFVILLSVRKFRR